MDDRKIKKRITAIVWGGSTFSCILEAAALIEEFEFKAFSTHQLQDSGERGRCLDSIRSSDLLFMYLGGGKALEELKPELEKLALRIPVVSVGNDPALAAISTVPKDVVKACHSYVMMGGIGNFSNMLKFIGSRILGLDLSCHDPEELPWEGIYHPEEKEVFSDIESYASRHIRKDRPTVGILFYRCYWVNNNMDTEKALVEELVRQGMNVIPAFAQSIGKTDFNSKPGSEVVREYFFYRNSRPRIDAFINLQASVLAPGKDDPNLCMDGGVELFRSLNVPVFHPVLAYYKTEEEWREDLHGVGSSIGWQVAMPEFQGMTEPLIIGVIRRYVDKASGASVERYSPIAERMVRFAGRVRKWIDLSRKKPAERKVAFILHNNPCASVEATVGSGAHLDTLESTARILNVLGTAGYNVSSPDSGKELIGTIMERKAVSEFRWTTSDEIVRKGGVLALVDNADYLKWFNDFHADIRSKLCDTWGNPPGEEKDGVPAAMLHDGRIMVTGVSYGNAVVCVQPKRGCAGSRCDGRVCKILHDPGIPPPHQYIATYRYLENVFGADVIIHVGTHGNLEFLPGKSVGLSESCLPDIAIGTLPHLYIYNADNPPEGTIAKRRSYAVLVDHMQTVMVSSGLYDKLEELSKLAGEYNKARELDRTRAHTLEHMIIDGIRAANLDKELKLDEGRPFDEVLNRVHEVLTRLRTTQIPDGMHVFGERPEGKARAEFIASILKYDFGDGISSRRILFSLLGGDCGFVAENPSATFPGSGMTCGEMTDKLDALALDFIERFLSDGKRTVSTEELNHMIGGLQSLLSSGDLEEQAGKSMDSLIRFKGKVLDISKSIDDSDETGSLLKGMSSEFISPGPSGLITRGRPDVLPTGRNFFSLDPKTIPTQAGWKVGKKLADVLIEKHRHDTGRYPENLACVWSATDIMWADGEEMGQILYLLGAEPVWQSNGRVDGYRIIPLDELGRPRIDVTIRLSGITRDCFSDCVNLLSDAVDEIARLPEKPEMNFVRKHIFEKLGTDSGDESSEEFADASMRFFGSRPGTYGSGVNLAIYASAWKDEEDLSDIFVYWNGYAYGRNRYGKELHGQLVHQLGSVEATFNKSVTDEYDLFGCCCHFSTQGGMSCAAKHISGREVRNYYGDTRNPSHVKVTDLADEIRRVVRTKLLNPKWIEGMKRHGYKGASDISKRVGRVYGWEATTQEVDDWIFDDIAKTFILDKDMKDFFQENNPWALEEISRRLMEAEQRGLWKADPEVLDSLKDSYVEIESWLEEDMGDVQGDFQGGSVDILTSDDIEGWKDKMKELKKHMHMKPEKKS